MTTTLALANIPSIFFGPEEEFECPDEEECEIDWDRMPGFDDDEENSAPPSNEELLPEASTPLSMAGASEVDVEKMEDEYAIVELQPQTYRNTVHNSAEKSRVLFEMTWQIDECKVNHDSCSDFCPECAGSGRQFCKFCRGTRTVVFGKEFRSCIICEPDGKVECSACKGTGSVAPWVATHEKLT
jgi:hypothetical protein